MTRDQSLLKTLFHRFVRWVWVLSPQSSARDFIQHEITHHKHVQLPVNNSQNNNLSATNEFASAYKNNKAKCKEKS